MESYKSARDAARKELGQLAIQRERIDKRIANLKKFLESAEPLFEAELLTPEVAHLLLAACGSDRTEARTIILNEGITDAIKRVFVLNDSLTPVEVKEQLILMGFDLRKHANPMANIHSVLKRLEEQGWLGPTEKDGKPALQRIVTKEQTADAFKRGLKELSGLKGDARETRRQEVLAELGANRKAAAKKK